MQLSNEKNINKKPVVLGVDVGTTNIRCYAYDKFANVLGKADEKVEIIDPGENRHEIAPDMLWESFQKVVNNCLIGSHLHANEVACMGISTQRGTFLTWDRETGQPYHNFITWKDKRADDISDQWNSCFFVKLLRFGCFLSYILTRITKFQVFSALKFTSSMVLMRLYWILENFPKIRHKCHRNKLLFGTIDTWLVWKLTGGEVHATDASNACITGFFDPFKMEWIDWIFKLFRIPTHVLPVVKNTSDSFGETIPSIFGSSIPICCVVGDQQASAFGAGCFRKYDSNCTMGTGSFFTINTGHEPFTSIKGVFPLVGWTIRSETTYIAECGIHEAGQFISWMQNLGFFKDPAECCPIAQSVTDTGGVYFLPTHTLLESCETGSFVGLRTSTTKEQLVRSVLESLAFQVCLLFDAVHKLCRRKLNMVRMCGGVAKNDFILQIISSITTTSLNRLKHGETSSRGAAFLAGLYCGVWNSLDELTELQMDYDSFSPMNELVDTHRNSFKEWEVAYKNKLYEKY